MSSFMRRKVSQNRKRYVDEKYDLDLTYIAENMIAMGYPSDNALQKLIRNQIEKVSKYLNEKHHESFRIFNLCKETDYDFSHFNYMVELFPIEDHNPPRFLQILDFCRSVDYWLKTDGKNVAIVHCKAGKGRTGTMISCYFLHSARFLNALDAMKEFDQKRCKDRKGVTIPSQRRFVEYYAYYLKNNLNYESRRIFLHSIKIHIPEEDFEFPKKLRLEIRENSDENILCQIKRSRSRNENSFNFIFDSPLQLESDIRVIFLTKKKASLLQVWFNTFFLYFTDLYKELEDLSSLGSMEYDANSNLFSWYLKTKDIDMAFKNKNIHSNLWLMFKFEINNPSKEKIEPETSKSSISKIDQSESSDSSPTMTCKVETKCIHIDLKK